MHYRASGGDSIPLPSVNAEPTAPTTAVERASPTSLAQAEHRFDAGAMRA